MTTKTREGFSTPGILEGEVKKGQTVTKNLHAPSYYLQSHIQPRLSVSSEVSGVSENINTRSTFSMSPSSSLSPQFSEEEDGTSCSSFSQLEKDVTGLPDDTILKLNVGGMKYYTTKGTLVSSPHSASSRNFFTGMFSGKYPIVKDDRGHIFIDRNGMYRG